MNREAKLLSGEGTAFEQAMLRSVKGEAPSPALRSQMMGPIVGAPPPLTGPPPAYAPGSGLATSAAAKWVGTAIFTLGIGGALVFGALRDSSKDIEPSTVSNQTEHVDTLPSTAQPIRTVQETADTSPDPTTGSPGADAGRKIDGDSSPEKHARLDGAPPERDRLADEMRLLDQARAALAQKTPDKALRLLGTYDARYPQGTLHQEATVLRVSALKGIGKESQAAQLADKFLEEIPNSAHKSRLQPEDGVQEPVP